MKEGFPFLENKSEVRKGRREIIPTYVYFYITHKCNLRCKHCWIGAGLPSQDELSTKEAMIAIRDIYQLGCRFIKFTGGEPFMRPDFMDLLKYTRSLGIDATIETNGILLTPEIINELSRLDVSVAVSIDGITRRSHEFLRGPGTFDRTLRVIENLARSGVNTQTITVANEVNRNEIPLLIEKLLKMDVNIIKINPQILPSGRGADILDINLSYVHLRQLVDFLIKKYYEFPRRILIDIPCGILPIQIARHTLNNCPWGYGVLGLLSNGDVSLCGSGYLSKTLVAGNIRKVSIEELWLESDFFRRIRAIKPKQLKGVCGNCLANKICRGGCRIYAYEVYSDLLAPHPICQMYWDHDEFPRHRLRYPNVDATYP
ncbi:MAG: radical SAM protein [Thermoproteota archaeon]|nr:radical SAM protein [Candidatus Brockarchaeota archaeon]